MGLSVVGCYCNGVPTQRLGFSGSRPRTLADKGQCADHAFAGVEAFRRLALAAVVFGSIEFGFDGGSYPLCDLVLHRKNVRDLAVVALGPDMVSGGAVDQLGGDPHPVARSSHAAFEHIAHAKLAADLLHIDSTAFVSERAVACDDKVPSKLRQRGDDLFDHAVSEVVLLRVAAQIGERKHRD